MNALIDLNRFGLFLFFAAGSSGLTLFLTLTSSDLQHQQQYMIHWNPASNTDKRKASLNCVFSCETSDCLIQWNFSHIADKHNYFLAGLTYLNIVLLTFVTSIILHDSTVNPNVYLQFTISVNVLLHYWLISIGLHSTVCLPVFFQTTWFSETLLPILTRRRLNCTLCFHVRLQTACFSETLVTLLTSITISLTALYVHLYKSRLPHVCVKADNC